VEGYTGSTTLGELALNSFWFATGSTAVAVAVGTALAFLLTRTNVPFKGVGFLISVLPLIIPGLLNTIAWVILASPRSGYLNRLIEPIVGPEFFDIFSMGGMIFVQGVDQAPLAFLLMMAAFRGMDPSLEECALVCGAGIPTVLRRITLPLMLPAVWAIVLILVVRGMESFEVPAILGITGGVWVFTSRIWRALDIFPADFGLAGAYSLSLVVVTMVGVYLYSRLSRRADAFQTVTGKAFRPNMIDLGRYRWAGATFVAGYALVAAVVPMLTILYMSTQRFYAPPSWESLANMQLTPYLEVIGDSRFLRALGNSFGLGISAATLVMLGMAIVAWLVIRTRARGRWLLDNLVFLPLTIPGLVLGVSLLFVYLRVPLPIYGTIWILLIAYVTKYMPYGMRYASNSMYQISSDLEESAMVSGATWWQRTWRVTIPLLKPGLIAGWMYIVVLSVRELSSSILLYSQGSEVLSVLMWQYWEHGFIPEISALGVMMVLILVLILMLARALGARVAVQE
jgi:iron(III) transport system permease protein